MFRPRVVRTLLPFEVLAHRARLVEGARHADVIAFICTDFTVYEEAILVPHRTRRRVRVVLTNSVGDD